MEKLNPLTDTTKFINIDNEPFDIYVDGKLARHLEAGEEDVMPVFVAKLGAKHLTDRVLGKQGVKDTNRPSPLRDETIRKIIPDAAEKVKVKPMTEEEYRESIKKRFEEQKELMDTLSGKTEKKEEKIKSLEKEIKKLKQKVARK